MSTTPSTPSDPPPGNHQRLSPEQAASLFRDYYRSLPSVPIGKFELDVDAVSKACGNTAGHSKQELVDIARVVRAEMREERSGMPVGGNAKPQGGSPITQQTVTRWIKGIGFGAFAAAGSGIIARAIYLYGLAPTFDSVRPYVFAILGCAVLLFLLNFARDRLEKSRLPQWMAQVAMGGTLLLFLITALGPVVWFVTWLLRDARILDPIPISNPGPVIFAPPDNFVYQACDGFSDPRLPDEMLGKIDDYQFKPRDWMLQQENHANTQFGKTCKKLWLLTDKFPVQYQSFDAKINVGVAEKVLVSCRLLEQAKPKLPLALSISKPTGAGQVIHSFGVPQTQTADRLLVFLAMPKDVFDSMPHDPRFKISSH